MLKIRDEVNLKELEKFEFEEKETLGDYYYDIEFKMGFYKEHLRVWKKDREIQADGIMVLNTLYDLIQAGLVEKID